MVSNPISSVQQSQSQSSSSSSSFASDNPPVPSENQRSESGLLLRKNSEIGSGKGRNYDRPPGLRNRDRITTSRDRDMTARMRWNRIDRLDKDARFKDDNKDMNSFKLSKYLSLNLQTRQQRQQQRGFNPTSSSSSSPTSISHHYYHFYSEPHPSTSSSSDSTTSTSPILTLLDDEPIYQNPPIYKRPNQDDSLALLLPLLILLSTLLFMLLLFVILIIIVRKRSRILLNDSNSPIDVGREEDLESSNSTSSMGGGALGGISGIEERWLESVPQPTRTGYLRSKDFLLSNPPNSYNTDITLQQYLSIQEKGVSAWSFEPDYENNPSVFVENRTEISFLGDGIGMTEEEGGGCNVQSNLPLPKLNEVYYWEAKMFTLPEGCNVSIGLATKPFPSFRLPGWSKYSIGYFSQDGFKSHNYPFFSQSYGPAFIQGDVIGCGYRPRTGTVFFTRNGKKLEDAFVGLNRYNLFPTIGANNSSEIHINLGQAGFVFIEANVKKWGLAPMVGTRAPPPAYGMERGSVLIEASRNNRVLEERREREERENRFFPTYSSNEVGNQEIGQPPRNVIGNSVDGDLIGNGIEATSRNQSQVRENARGSERRYGTLNRNFNNTAPSRSSPLRRSVTRMNTEGNLSERNLSSPEDEVDPVSVGNEGMDQDQAGEDEEENHSPRPRAISSASSSEGQINNPPTPGRLDISLHALDSNGHSTSSNPSTAGNSNRNSTHSNRTIRGGARAGENGSYFPSTSNTSSSSTSDRSGNNRIARSNSPQPPSYDSLAAEREREISRNNSSGNGVREFANSLINLLGERGLLNPINANTSSSSLSNPNVGNNGSGGSHNYHRGRGDEPPSFNHAASSSSSTAIDSYEANSSRNVEIENDLDQNTRENTARNGRRVEGGERRSWSDWARSLTGRS